MEIPKKRLVVKLRESTSFEKAFDHIPRNVKAESLLYEGKGNDRDLNDFEKKIEFGHQNSYNKLDSFFQVDKRTYLIDVENEDELNSLMASFKNNENDVESVYEDGFIEFHSPILDPEYEKHQRLPFGELQIPEVWIEQEYGLNTLIGVIDTGVNPEHTDIKPSLWKENETVGVNFSDIGGPMTDGFYDPGHGTPIAGILSAVINNIGVVGIAPQSQIVMFKCVTNGSQAFMSDAKKCFNKALNLKIPLVNCSWDLGKTAPTSQASLEFINSLKRYSEKMTLVFSAGNDGLDIRSTFLEELPNVIKVGAMNTDNTRCNYSNFGSDVIYAFGKLMSTSKNGKYDEFTGTSCAAPQVTGICSLLLSYNSKIHPKDLKDIIYSTCDFVGTNPNNLRRVNAKKAFDYLKNITPRQV